jgi:hypothetical protein
MFPSFRARSLAISLLLSSALLSLLSSPASAQGFTPQHKSKWFKLGYIQSSAAQNFAGIDEVRWNRYNLENNPSLEDREIAYGERTDFRSRQGDVIGGELVANEVTLDAMYAPLPRVVVGGFIPIYKRAYYENPRPYETEEKGAGDLQLFAGYQLTPAGQYKVGSTVYIRGKIPTSSKFPYTNESILGEGQFDLSAALGNSLSLLPRLYLNNTIELRHRFGWLGNGSDSEGRIAIPGDELHVFLGLGGGPTEWLWLNAGWAGMWGQAWLVQQAGEAEPDFQLERQFHAAQVSAYFSFGKFLKASAAQGLALDVFAKIPLAGRDHAVLYSFGGGLAYGF